MTATDVSNTTSDAANQYKDAQVMLKARAQFYNMLSSFYMRPLTQEEVETMAASDFSDLRRNETNSEIAQGFEDIFRYLRKRNTGTRQELAADFTGVFDGIQTFEGRQAMPYESLFRDDSGLLMRAPRNEVYETFKHAHLQVTPGIDLPEDHLSFEFEFMAVLCERAEEALAKQDIQACIESLKTQAKFFELHIASWFEDFYDLAFRLVGTRFYRGVLRITHGFLDSEPATIEALKTLVAEEAGSSNLE